MAVLVTGASGFVGENLGRYLGAKGWELWALEREGREKVEGYARVYSWERIGEVPWEEVEAVVHLAGKAHDTKGISEERKYFEVNEGLVRQCLNALVPECLSGEERSSKVLECRSSKVKSDPRKSEAAPSGFNAETQRRGGGGKRGVAFVLFSSVKAVADRVEGVLMEEVVAAPETAYGRSKLAAERAVMEYADKGIVPYILRPAMIHGPGNKGNLNLLYKVARRGWPWPLAAFENERSFVSVENICAVVEGILRGGVESGVYNVADDDTISTNELIELMGESAGRRARLWRVPKGLVRWVARVGDRLRLPLNSERLQKLTESYVVGNGKVKKALGWDRMPVGARAGMRRSVSALVP